MDIRLLDELDKEEIEGINDISKKEIITNSNSNKDEIVTTINGYSNRKFDILTNRTDSVTVEDNNVLVDVVGSGFLSGLNVDSYKGGKVRLKLILDETEYSLIANVSSTHMEGFNVNVLLGSEYYYAAQGRGYMTGRSYSAFENEDNNDVRVIPCYIPKPIEFKEKCNISYEVLDRTVRIGVIGGVYID